MMRWSLRGVLFSAALLVLVAAPARASMIFTATLTSAQENPAIPDEGSGRTGTFVLNDAMTRLTYDVQLFGLDIDGLQTPGNANDNVTRAHFHRGPPGSNGGIVFGIIDGSPTLLNDNNPNDRIVNPITSHISGAWDLNEGNLTTLSTELPFLLSGGLYFNVHTTDHGGGEIRGQVIPEPGAIALLTVALAPLCGRKRRVD